MQSLLTDFWAVSAEEEPGVARVPWCTDILLRALLVLWTLSLVVGTSGPATHSSRLVRSFVTVPCCTAGGFLCSGVTDSVVVSTFVGALTTSRTTFDGVCDSGFVLSMRSTFSTSFRRLTGWLRRNEGIRRREDPRATAWPEIRFSAGAFWDLLLTDKRTEDEWAPGWAKPAGPRFCPGAFWDLRPIDKRSEDERTTGWVIRARPRFCTGVFWDFWVIDKRDCVFVRPRKDCDSPVFTSPAILWRGGRRLQFFTDNCFPHLTYSVVCRSFSSAVIAAHKRTSGACSHWSKTQLFDAELGWFTPALVNKCSPSTSASAILGSSLDNPTLSTVQASPLCISVAFWERAIADCDLIRSKRDRRSAIAVSCVCEGQPSLAVMSSKQTSTLSTLTAPVKPGINSKLSSSTMPGIPGETKTSSERSKVSEARSSEPSRFAWQLASKRQLSIWEAMFWASVKICSRAASLMGELVAHATPPLPAAFSFARCWGWRLFFGSKALPGMLL